MAKQVTGKIKLQCPGGQATPAPPVGPALGAHGVNIAQFVKQFNDATRENMGLTIPVEITVYNDRTFEFALKSPPAAVLIKKELGLAKGSGSPKDTKVGTINAEQLLKIVKIKEADLNHASDEAGMRIIAGTARSMGVNVEGLD